MANRSVRHPSVHFTRLHPLPPPAQFNGEELPSEEAMQALGGPVKAEEMYELARKLWGLPEAAGR